MSDRKSRRQRHRRAKKRAAARQLTELLSANDEKMMHFIVAARNAEQERNRLRNILSDADRLLGGNVLTVLSHRCEREHSMEGYRHTYAARRFQWLNQRGLVRLAHKDVQINRIVSDEAIGVGPFLHDACVELGRYLADELRTP